MPLILILVLLYFAWRYKQGHSKATSKRPTKTATLGGSNLPGNNFDNGTTQGLGPSIPCDCPTSPGTVTYATQGGEDGSDPTAAPPPPPTSSPVTTGNGWVAANQDPPPLTLTPSFSGVINAVKNSRFVKAL